MRRNRNLQLVLPRWHDPAPHEEHNSVTTPLRTVLDCARDLPFSEALAVADSALRAGMVDLAQLRKRAGGLRGPGAMRARRLAEHADGRAVNAVESVVRAAGW